MTPHVYATEPLKLEYLEPLNFAEFLNVSLYQIYFAPSSFPLKY